MSGILLSTSLILASRIDKIMNLQAFDSTYFHDKNFFGDDCFQNKFLYQPKYNTLEL